MKLTKSRLKQIIKEELQKAMLDEYGDAPLDGDTEDDCNMKGGTWDASKKPGMRCTYSKEFNETKSGETHEEKERKAIAQMKDLMLNAHKLYNELSKDVPGKKDLKHLRPFLIKNFEMYAQRWKEDMQGAEAEEEEHEI